MLYEAIHNTVSRFIRIRPISLILLVTDKCNARCVMCNIWKEGVSLGHELSYHDYVHFLANRIFSNVTAVMLSGGEALLRPDVVELAGLIVRSLPRVNKVTIATNGLATDLVTRRVGQIAETVKSCNASRSILRKVHLFIQVSYDAVSATHDRIRGPNAHERVTKTLQNLVALRRQYDFLKISAGCVIQPINLAEIEQVYDFLKLNAISSIFTVICYDERYFKNREGGQIQFSESQRKEAQELLSRLIKKERHIGKKFLYRELKNMLGGAVNTRGCPALRDVFAVEPNGDIIPCLNSSDHVMGNVLKDDPHDVWFSRRNHQINDAVRNEKCGRCMFACGVSYLDVLKFTLLGAWRS